MIAELVVQGASGGEGRNPDGTLGRLVLVAMPGVWHGYERAGTWVLCNQAVARGFVPMLAAAAPLDVVKTGASGISVAEVTQPERAISGLAGIPDCLVAVVRAGDRAVAVRLTAAPLPEEEETEADERK